MTASLLRSLGLFPVFWPISAILQSVWSRVFHWFSIPPAPSPSLSELFQAHQLQLVSMSLSYSTAFFFSGQVQVFVHLFVFFYFYFMARKNGKIHLTLNSLSLSLSLSLHFICLFLVCLLINTRSGLLAEIKWYVSISKSQKILCVLL